MNDQWIITPGGVVRKDLSEEWLSKYLNGNKDSAT